MTLCSSYPSKDPYSPDFVCFSLTDIPVLPVLLLLAGLILLFYLVFYIFLAGMFALTMYVMLQTLDDHKPTWQDRLATPGRLVSTRLTNKLPGRLVSTRPYQQTHKSILHSLKGLSKSERTFKESKSDPGRCSVVRVFDSQSTFRQP